MKKGVYTMKIKAHTLFVCLLATLVVVIGNITGCSAESVTETLNITETTTIAGPTQTVTAAAQPVTITETSPPVTVTSVITVTATLQNQIYEDISPEEAYQLIQDNAGNPKFMIIDARSATMRATDGHIEGDKNMGWDIGFATQFRNLDRCGTYLVYSSRGEESLTACECLLELGFFEFYHLHGGLLTWQSQGFPVVP